MTARTASIRATITRALAGAVVLAMAAGATARQVETPLTPPPGAARDTDPDTRPREVRGLEIRNRLGDPIPLGLTFTNVDNSMVELGRFFNRPAPSGKHDKPVVMMMVYFRCPILCPMVLEKFTKTLNEIDFTAGTDYDAVIVSFDPRDTPADAVRQRANQLLFYRQPTTDSIRDGWTFLTSDKLPENARALARALGFEFREVPRTDDYAHGAAVFVLTPDGRVSRTLLGLEYPARDVRLALLEAGEGKIGNLLDRFTLWCYHFDPKAGSYTLAAMRVMQMGAALGAVLLAVFLLVLFRFDRRKMRRFRQFRAGDSPAAAAASHPSVPDSRPQLTPALGGRA